MRLEKTHRKMHPSMLLHICTKSGRENTLLPIVFPNNVHINMCSIRSITHLYLKVKKKQAPETERLTITKDMV